MCSIQCWITWMIRVELVLYISIYIFMWWSVCWKRGRDAVNRNNKNNKKKMGGLATSNQQANIRKNRFLNVFAKLYLHDFTLPIPFRFFNSQNEQTFREFHFWKLHIFVVYISKRWPCLMLNFLRLSFRRLSYRELTPL